MDKQASAKWRLYALANKAHDAAWNLGTIGRLPKPVYIGSNPGNYAGNVAETAATRDAVRSYLRSNPRLARKMGRFLRENPSVKLPNKLTYYKAQPKTTWANGGMAQGPGGATPRYSSIEEFAPHMRDLETAGAVRSVPTPHEPYRKEFFRVPPEAVTTLQGSVDLSKTVPTGVPLSANAEANMAVGNHMLFNRHGAAAASVPKVELMSFSGGQSPKTGLSRVEQVKGPAYDKVTDTVYMPNVAGMHNMKKDSLYDMLVGKDVGLPANNAMRSILEHEWAGHGMLYRENADYLSRLARKSSALISRSLKNTPYSYNADKRGITLGEFMANYHAANPGSVIRGRTLDMFNRRNVRDDFIGAFNNNMAGMSPDVVARTKSGLQQAWDNYGAVSSPYGWLPSIFGSAF